MHRKARTFALQCISMSCLAGVLLFTSFCFKKSEIDRKQNHLCNFAKQATKQAFQTYFMALDIALFRLKHAPSEGVEIIFKDLKKASPLIETVTLETSLKSPCIRSVSKNILEDNRSLNTSKIIKLRLNLQPIFQAFYPNIWVEIKTFYNNPLDQHFFLQSLDIKASPFSFWIYIQSCFSEVLCRLLLVFLIFSIFRVQSLRKFLSISFWKTQDTFRKKYKKIKLEQEQQAKDLDRLDNLNNLLRDSALQQKKLFKKVVHHYKKMAKVAEHLQNTTFTLQKESNFLEKDENLFILKSANNLLKHLANGFIFSEEPTEVDIKKTVLEILTIFQPIFHSKSIQLTLEIPEGAIVSCDALSLQMVLYNILELLEEGFFKNHHLLIRFKENPNLELQFQEDGFALKAPQTSTSSSNLLGFSREDLGKFVKSMGCSLSFNADARGPSVTRLFFQNPTVQGSNVLHFSTFMKAETL
ncbi:MAG: hypothetical protein ACRCYP_04565 [Alphaproteobacteria bacterium]